MVFFWFSPSSPLFPSEKDLKEFDVYPLEEPFHFAWCDSYFTNCVNFISTVCKLTSLIATFGSLEFVWPV